MRHHCSAENSDCNQNAGGVNIWNKQTARYHRPLGSGKEKLDDITKHYGCHEHNYCRFNPAEAVTLQGKNNDYVYACYDCCLKKRYIKQQMYCNCRTHELGEIRCYHC